MGILHVSLSKGLRARSAAPKLFTHGNQERCNVLAVAFDLRKKWAVALGAEAFGCEGDLHVVRRIGRTADPPARLRLVDGDLGDCASADVVDPAQIRARTEQFSQGAIAEAGNGLGQWSGRLRDGPPLEMRGLQAKVLPRTSL